MEPASLPEGYVACPRCGSSQVKKVGYTWWGGALGPRLLHHARCTACGATYNGRTGRSNTAAIVIYSIVVIAAVLLLMAALSSLFSGCGAGAPQEFRSEAGRFSVMAPVALKETTQSVDTEAGKIELHMFTGERRSVAYIVGYSDYPADLVAQTSPDAILDGAVQGAAGNVNGTVITQTEIDLDGHPGREMVVEARPEKSPEMAFKGRIYLVENRLFQVLVVAPKSQAGTVDMDGYLGSFKLAGE